MDNYISQKEIKVNGKNKGGKVMEEIKEQEANNLIEKSKEEIRLSTTQGVN